MAVGYQAPVNQALREHVEGWTLKFEDDLGRIVREEDPGGRLRISRP